MAPKVLYCAFFILNVYFVASENNDMPNEISPMASYEVPFKGQKCVAGKSYHDGCNLNFCAGNKQEVDGAWTPIIMSTLILCYNSPQLDPPTSFYEHTMYRLDDNVQEKADKHVNIYTMPNGNDVL
ncbi:uncharacterized protein LOC106646953 [Copidosoma floridanum]|uniref:uncharacterized protein LOC106646953 n=1 Tax=Copidosoma floridanum TaxID=29053 RepID=UPI0006C96CA5|nr:uncharacterized protein LOC106646953 [Copidosoma floridanum]